ncbi:MAG: S24/S26 family peptidase [Lachnospiraceae bacterium]|nr:S24/S26 family peptidase [Lachnospiraceae bacterium]
MSEMEQKLQAGNAVSFTIHGNSMFPLLVGERDRVVVEPVGRLKRGMVALYRRDDGRLILHRIHRVSEEGIYMVGDNQSGIEGPLRRSQVLGEATVFFRGGRRIKKNDPGYVMYAGIWLMARPFRKFFANLYHIFKRS